jgi:hypothetical protein
LLALEFIYTLLNLTHFSTSFRKERDNTSEEVLTIYYGKYVIRKLPCQRDTFEKRSVEKVGKVERHTWFD